MANALRGEAELLLGGIKRLLRPTFDALVKVEAELGPLFALIERAVTLAAGGATRTAVSDGSSLVYTAAQQIADTGAPVSLLSVRVAQISATVGGGAAAFNILSVP